MLTDADVIGDTLPLCISSPLQPWQELCGSIPCTTTTYLTRSGDGPFVQPLIGDFPFFIENAHQASWQHMNK